MALYPALEDILSRRAPIQQRNVYAAAPSRIDPAQYRVRPNNEIAQITETPTRSDVTRIPQFGNLSYKPARQEAFDYRSMGALGNRLSAERSNPAERAPAAPMYNPQQRSPYYTEAGNAGFAHERVQGSPEGADPRRQALMNMQRDLMSRQKPNRIALRAKPQGLI